MVRTKKDNLSTVLTSYGPSRHILGEPVWQNIFPDIVISKEKCPKIFKSMRLLQFFEQGYYLMPLIPKSLGEMNYVGSLNLLRESSMVQYEAEHLLAVCGRNEYVLFGSVLTPQSLRLSVGELPNFLLTNLITLIPEIMGTSTFKEWTREAHAATEHIVRAEEEQRWDDVLQEVNRLQVVQNCLPNVSEVAQLVTIVQQTYGEYLFVDKVVMTRDRYSATSQATMGSYDTAGIMIMKQSVRDRFPTTGIVMTIPLSILFDIKI
jgi:hypothetical protein